MSYYVSENCINLTNLLKSNDKQEPISLKATYPSSASADANESPAKLCLERPGTASGSLKIPATISDSISLKTSTTTRSDYIHAQLNPSGRPEPEDQFQLENKEISDRIVQINSENKDNIYSIFLNHNNLETLNDLDFLWNCRHIKLLDLSFNRFSNALDFLKILNHFKCLSRIYLNSNSLYQFNLLQDVPVSGTIAGIGSLSKSNPKAKPGSLVGAPRTCALELLDISLNKLTTVKLTPPHYFKALKYLNLGSNLIETVYWTNKNINNISTISADTVLIMTELPCLASLNISRNQISVFTQLPLKNSANTNNNIDPDHHDIQKQSLKRLELQNNKLSVICLNSIHFKNLISLNLSNNSLFAQLKRDIFESMYFLEYLYLNNNHNLENLPNLKDLISLKLLDISTTAIITLPTDIASLPLLCTLELVSPMQKSRNYPFQKHTLEMYAHFVYPPPSIVYKGLDEIVKFLIKNSNLRS